MPLAAPYYIIAAGTRPCEGVAIARNTLDVAGKITWLGCGNESTPTDDWPFVQTLVGPEPVAGLQTCSTRWRVPHVFLVPNVFCVPQCSALQMHRKSTTRTNLPKYPYPSILNLRILFVSIFSETSLKTKDAVGWPILRRRCWNSALRRSCNCTQHFGRGWQNYVAGKCTG